MSLPIVRLAAAQIVPVLERAGPVAFGRGPISANASGGEPAKRRQSAGRSA